MVGLGVGLGTTVLLGDGSVVELGTKLGRICVEMEWVVAAVGIGSFVCKLHPAVNNTRNHPSVIPVIVWIKLLLLPINNSIMGNYRPELQL